MNKTLGLIAAPILTLAVVAAVLAGDHSTPVVITAGVVTWTAVWWILEPIPIAATSLIPLCVLPACGVLTSEQVAGAYGSKLVLLLMGGFMLSTAMERSGAHRRLALTMVRAFGGRDESGADARRVVFGFMAATALLSMWISNAATTLMMLPIAMAVVETSESRRLPVCLLLGIAFSASVGGIGTPIGTPPNLIFFENYVIAGGEEPTFARWILWTWPIIALMLPLQALWLTKNLSDVQKLKLPEVGEWRSEEVRTLAVFAVTALLWVTRASPGGGWSYWLGVPDIDDARVALLAVLAMHLIPNGKGEALLTWKQASKIPWGILILCAGGLAIAEAFRSAGISEIVARQLAGLGEMTPIWLVATICLTVTFLTEVTSNTATANLLLPILAVVPVDDPKIVMIPATISASFAFMLPAATLPNAIIFASGRITVRDMARAGLVLNLVGVVVVTVVCYLML
ncbi:SLC13/DASS family transporter [Roseiconus nitratireducens]|uniref:SLC13/DASS family transporter n=1 Tax=Roseiconus nitratireducens TaxID=2605748 RepID=A0A5M6D4Z6_9BACT|nr:SLC13 family permease [Roseiconus nitratireducens]KAA5541382.1 SLC13/DASS family transporter [Roseiconus nitratireducens]